MKKFIKFFLVLPLFLLLFSAFLPLQKYHWHRSMDGKVLIWTSSNKDFTWSSEVKGEFAHGKGIIHYYERGVKKGSDTLNLIYGADKKQYKEFSNGTFYVGEYRGIGWNSEPYGIGVKRNANSVYAGEIKSSFLNGHGYYFLNDLLEYEGEFLKDKYSGNGKLYSAGKLIYAGEFNDDKKHGKGIEYIDGAEFKGNFKNGNKTGIFTISRNGTERIVEFLDDKPKLDKCKIVFADGTQWEGPLNTKYEPDGEGKTTTAEGFSRPEIRTSGVIEGEQIIPFGDGTEYKGEFKNNKKNGYGKISFKDGSRYSGMWSDDSFNGYGELISKDFSYYGVWEKGQRNGEGVFESSAEKYSGEWKYDKKYGLGNLESPKIKYNGTWADNNIHGVGKAIFADGSYYEGYWQNNKRSGYGEYVWADGTEYNGYWKDDLPDDEGDLTFPNGDFFSGKIANGNYQGDGIYSFANGDRYEGNFESNRRSGKGTYYFNSGNVYTGEFSDDKPNGNGTFYFENGMKYEGEFKDGKIFGKGSMFIPDGDDYAVLTSDKWNGNSMPNCGTFLFPNGDEFIGELINGLPSKNGTWTTREERLNGRSTSIKIKDFYEEHEESIEKYKPYLQIFLGVIGIGAEIVGCPYVAAGAIVVNTVISAGNIMVKTNNLAVDISDAKRDNATSEEYEKLIKQYGKDVFWDLLDVVAIKGAFKGVKVAKASKAASSTSKALSAIKKHHSFYEIAKTGNFTGTLKRGIISKAYGKVGGELVSKFGDTATDLLFKYGDNAVYLLTEGGETVVKVAEYGGSRGLNVLFSNGSRALNALNNANNSVDAIKFISSAGKTGIEILECSGKNAPNIANNFVKYGDDYLNLIRSEKKLVNVAKLSKNYGETAVETLVNVQKNDPKNINKVIKYINTEGKEAIKNIKNNNYKLPDGITNKTLDLSGKIAKSSIRKITNEMLAKPAIKLPEKELMKASKDSSFLRELIFKYTGKTFKDGFQEFFIRMSKDNHEQVKILWETQRDLIESGIRRDGGKHEWLMCRNFIDFLINPKWGKDGPYLANAITKLVQNTDNVVFKNGGRHGANGSGIFHKVLYQTINSCNNAAEIYSKLQKYTKEVLERKSYDEFMEILKICLE